MPWKPLPQIAFAVAICPFTAQVPADLPLELGDELYIIEQGGYNDEWLRGYLVAQPSLLAGLTSSKGQTLEARVFSGIFPKSCVEVREILGYDETNESGLNSPSILMESDGTDKHSLRDGKSLAKIKRKSSVKVTSRTWRLNPKSISARNSYEYPIRDLNAAKPQAPVPMLKIGDETPTSTAEPLVDEIASCLREWHSTYLHQILLAGDYERLEKIALLVKSLDTARKQLLYGVLTKHELMSLRIKIVWELVQGNKLLGAEIIVRDPTLHGRILTGNDSASEVTRLQTTMSLLDEQPYLTAKENLNLYHILVDLKKFASTCTHNMKLVFLLASKAPGQTATILSESYVINIPKNGNLTSLVRTEEMRTLFTDLSCADIGDSSAPENEIFLLVQRQTMQLVLGSEHASRTASRDVTPNRTPPPTTSSIGKAGRRSFMWGGKTSKNIIFRSSSSAKIVRDTMSRQSHTVGQDSSPRTSLSISSMTNDRKVATQHIYRTVAVGVLKLNDMIKQNDECEKLMSMWSPGQVAQDGRVYSLEEAIQESTNPENSHQVEQLQLNLKSFSSPSSESLIKMHPTLLSSVTATKKMGFSGAPSKTRSDIYLVIDQASLPPHVLLTRATGSALPLSQNLAGLNLQITLGVRNSNGGTITGCIFPYSNSEGQSTWESTAIKRGESWRQSLRLAIPTSQVSTCHLVFMLTDMPNGPVAFCFMRLWEQQVFLPNGDHSLLLYGCDENIGMTNKCEGNTGYLSFPWNTRGKDNVSKDEAVTGPIASLRVQTYLCSTLLLQDKILASLFKWKELPDVQIQELLERILFVSDVEMVKLLDDVFDALFGILAEKSGDEYSDLVFSALVTVLGNIHDRRFNMGALVDDYTKHKFHSPFATPCLLRSFAKLLANPSDPDSSRKLRATFKVFKYILKFVARSSDQQKEKEAELGITSTSRFPRYLKSIFKAFDKMMLSDAPTLVGNKTLVVQHFHTWLPELASLLSKKDIIQVAIDFINSCATAKGKLVLYKLVLIINISKMDLFSEKEERKTLSVKSVQWIAPHWGNSDESIGQWRDQIRLCCSIILSQLEHLTHEIPEYIQKIVESYAYILTAPKPVQSENPILSLPFPQTYPFPSKPIFTAVNFDEALIELSTVLSEISRLPAGMQLDLATADLAKLLEDMLNLNLSILKYEAYPSNWLSIHIYQHKSILIGLEYIGRLLLERFLPDPDNAENYKTELWQAFFTVLLKLVGSNELSLETFPEQKRRSVWKIAGDVRETGAELLRTSWEMIGWETSPEEKKQYGLAKMGGYQVQYVPCLVGPIVELCLSVHQGLRRVAIDILRTMIVSEWVLSGDISIIQTEMIECLDQIFKSKPLTENILQKVFINELESLFSPLSDDNDDTLYTAVQGLISTISEFLDLLVAICGTDVTDGAAQIINRLRLMELLRDIQKEEILIRYIHQLVQLHSDAGNPAEAGLSLRLHADLYDWDPTRILPALEDPEFPTQTHFERKERLYFDMIKFFEDGEAWSCALSAYEELQMQYQNNVFDFSKLARTLKSIGSIYEVIAKSDIIVPRYFRVVYRGLGFPPTLRDKQFVYEGYPNEKQAAFQDRLQASHPSVQIITANDVPDVEGQFLQIFSLTLCKDLSHPVLQRARVPQSVKDFLMFSFPRTFSITHMRNTSGSVTEHMAEKTLYKTVDCFPTLLRYSEIETVSRQPMNALETGLERVCRKTGEISILAKRVSDGDNEIAPLLIEALQISVDPNSNSTVSRYRDLLPDNFLDEEDELQPPVLTTLENALKTALIDYALTIRRCLSMFLQPDKKTLMGDIERELLILGLESTFAPELTSHAFPNPPDVRSHKGINLPLSSPASPPTNIHNNTQVMGLGLSNHLTTSNMSATDLSSTPTGKRFHRIFNKLQERQEDSTSFLESVVPATTPTPAARANGSLETRNKRSKTHATSLTRGRGTSDSITSRKTQSTSYSNLKDNTTNIRERDTSRHRKFIYSGKLSRASHREDLSEYRSQSELGHRSNVKPQPNFRDTIYGDTRFITKGSLSKMSGGVKNKLTLVGRGLGRKKSVAGISGNMVAEEG